MTVLRFEVSETRTRTGCLHPGVPCVKHNIIYYLKLKVFSKYFQKGPKSAEFYAISEPFDTFSTHFKSATNSVLQDV